MDWKSSFTEQKTRYARSAVWRLISQRSTFRGRAREDGAATLLTVDYRSTADVARLVASWERFCTGPVLIVQNTGWRDRRIVRAAAANARVVGGLANLHHGLGLDYGMRLVKTEYVVICDPDSLILSASFLPALLGLVDTYGVGSIALGTPTYSPMCLAFRTADWKRSTISMKYDWEVGYDVAGAMTARYGGYDARAVLPRTRETGGADGPLSRPVVYGDVFSCAVGGSRRFNGAEAFSPSEGEFEKIVRSQDLWRSWADGFLSDERSLEDFPA